MLETVEWKAEGVALIDQRVLPGREEILLCRKPEEVMAAIRDLVVRGAPAIGVTAGMGLALGANRLVQGGATDDEFDRGMERLYEDMAATRPTAVNLFWAIERMKGVAAKHRGAGPAAVAEALTSEAHIMKEQDVASCRAMGAFGQVLVPDGGTILTHCNAGALATAGYGTALGVVRAAVEAGKKVSVLADETRPFLQGARLTAWELAQDNIPVTVITDGMAGHFMQQRKVDVVVVGADRIASNGDVANKIGTYQVAVLAKENDIPFYVAAPLSTIDFEIPDGTHIPIEQRDPAEVTKLGDMVLAPAGVPALHPAFDVTPNRYVAAIITDQGVARAPYTESLAALRKRQG